MMKKYLKLLRVKHYIKNLLILFPLIFNKNFTSESIYLIILGLMTFSFISSFVYIINDIRDLEADKKHEIKKSRPIASGAVSVRRAIIIALILLCTSVALTLLYLNIWSFVLLLIYIIINLAYSFGYKNIPILDIAILAFGFVIRLYYGALIFEIEISQWLYLTVMSFAFYLALGKRRNELIKSGSKTRTVLAFYNKEFLDKHMYLFLTIGIVFYSLWAFTQKHAFILTIPFVILILMKYNLTVENNSHGDPVEVVFSDKFLLGLILVFCVVVLILLYF